MKVLFLSRLFYPHIGGVEKHVQQVAVRLIKLGHEVTVITETLPQRGKNQKSKVKNKIQKLKIEGINVLRIPVGKDDWFKKFRIWREIWINRKLIQESDIVHVHDVFFWYLPFRFLYPSKKIFTTFHGYETKYPPSRKAIILRKIGEVLSRGNICVGDYIRKWYGTKPDFITYGGIETPNYKYQISKKFPIQNARYKILFLGRLESDTGIHTYLKALNILKRKKIKFEFKICGDGVFRKQAEKLGRVYGFVKDPTSYLQNSDIIFTSSYLSMLQALVLGKIVIAVYNNALKKDYLRMSPFAKYILIFSNKKKIVDFIISVISEPHKFKSMQENGQKWAKSQTWDKVVSLYLNLWKK